MATPIATTDSRRKPKIFVENGRRPQIEALSGSHRSQPTSLAIWHRGLAFRIARKSMPIFPDAAFLLTVGSFLLTVELFYLQLTILAFLLTIGAFLLTILAFLLAVVAFLLAVGKCV